MMIVILFRLLTFSRSRCWLLVVEFTYFCFTFLVCCVLCANFKRWDRHLKKKMHKNWSFHGASRKISLILLLCFVHRHPFKITNQKDLDFELTVEPEKATAVNIGLWVDILLSNSLKLMHGAFEPIWRNKIYVSHSNDSNWRANVNWVTSSVYQLE